ncbi:hypothetical protein B0T20DRAFT_409193 [Sordaria brevicollis]|uniref:Secreted protein n=1 Tax=Sordaria brevicollis TaxID=83679 RepID=A0AAE0PFX4_SORBR|nr:hypothetical protein B0T20DRAFT_409193 [Sordaria brevicollis]
MPLSISIIFSLSVSALVEPVPDQSLSLPSNLGMGNRLGQGKPSFSAAEQHHSSTRQPFLIETGWTSALVLDFLRPYCNLSLFVL